jgi:hypothetical protein
MTNAVAAYRIGMYQIFLLMRACLTWRQ